MASPNAAIRRRGQGLKPGNLISLYIIDLSTIGVDQMFAFTSARDEITGSPVFRGITYNPYDIKCEGFELSGKVSPTPIVSLGNATRVMSSAAVLYNDLIGARFIRTRTYTTFLDNGATPDQEAAYAQDIYLFDQKLKHDDKEISWQLASPMDQEGRQIPGRLIVAGVCLARYRQTKKTPSGAFSNYDYSQVQCPFNDDTKAYDINGDPCALIDDKPSRRVKTCCKARFGQNGVLPFWGFPGVSRVKI